MSYHSKYFSSFNVSFIYKAAFFLETTNLCKIVLVIKSSYDDDILNIDALGLEAVK